MTRAETGGLSDGAEQKTLGTLNNNNKIEIGALKTVFLNKKICNFTVSQQNSNR